MAAFLTDQRIAELLVERKPLPADWRRRVALKVKRGHLEADLEIVGADGSEFRLLSRRSMFNVLAFSAILAYRVPDSNQLLRRKRYNGKNHRHTNPIEGVTFYDFHIHTATERYQRSGSKEDTFAEVTDRYASLEEAVQRLFADCYFEAPDHPQGELF